MLERRPAPLSIYDQRTLEYANRASDLLSKFRSMKLKIEAEKKVSGVPTEIVRDAKRVLENKDKFASDTKMTPVITAAENLKKALYGISSGGQAHWNNA